MIDCENRYSKVFELDIIIEKYNFFYRYAIIFYLSFEFICHVMSEHKYFFITFIIYIHPNKVLKVKK